MSAENGDTSVVFAMPAPVNGDRSLVNGLTNGHSSSSSSSKHRSSSSSSHHKSSSKDKHRSSSSSSSKHRSSSSGGSGSSSKDKSSSTSSSSSRDKDKPSTGSSSSSTHKSSSSSSSSKDKDRHRSSSSSHRSDKDRKDDKPKSSSSSSSASGVAKDGTKEHKSSSSGNKEHKSSSSSSSSKDKHRSSSSSSSRDKDRHKGSSNGGSSSSSSKHKHSSSSSSSTNKHPSSSSADKEKSRSSSSNNHHSSSSHNHKSSGVDSIKAEIKLENPTPVANNTIAAQPQQQQQPPPAINNNHNSNHTPDNIDPLALPQFPTPPGSGGNGGGLHAASAVKLEPSLDHSTASSCDYSLTQFRPDESRFETPNTSAVKHERAPIAGAAADDDDDDDEEDAPIVKRFKAKPEPESDDSEDAPILAAKKPVKTEKPKKAKKKKHYSDDEDEDYEDDQADDDDYGVAPAKKPKKEKKEKKVVQQPPSAGAKAAVKRESLNNSATSPQKAGGRKKKAEEPEEVWKWWEEEKRDDGVKWNFLEHRGPVFAPDYEPLPANVHFEYDGRPMQLSPEAEEIACFYAKMLNHDFTSKPVFNDNFFGDWRKAMTSKERERITKLKSCNFQHMFEHFTAISERNKQRTKEEKAALKAENEALMAEYGFCTIDGHKEKIGNFRIEPPGLFRGRGEHPKMGKIKKRVQPEDIMINCAKGSQIPQPPAGHRWREVKHDNTVTWLASWTENVQGQVKYVMLNPSSKLKGEKDWQKYETARRLHKHIDRIRNAYKEEWKSKEMRIRQRGVALYFIDKLALRAGNEKDEDQADTVGCCSLRVEHIQLVRQMGDKENVVVFDFLGKDSIRYYNEVEVEKRVFKNLELFKENKKEGDDLFDRLNTVVMNEHLRELMDGLTAKVFRTYNASWTLQCQLNEMTDAAATLPEKMLAYNRANRAVAVLCNHQRAVPKSHEKSMENLKEKIRAKREQVDDLQVDVKNAVKEAKHGSMKEKINADKKKKQLQRALEQLKKMELQETDRDENKTIALGTSKLNYLDPRISVAWCKKYDVPIDKIYNKTQRDKFRWAIDMATEDYQF